MTEQGLREQLNNIRRAHRALEHNLERRNHLWEKATAAPAIRTDRDKIKSSPSNKHTAIMDALADLDLEIEAQAEALEKEKKKAAAQFDRAGFTKQEAEVMQLRYIDCLSWYDISDVMYWSTRQVQRIHGEALLKLGALWHTLAHPGT